MPLGKSECEGRVGYPIWYEMEQDPRRRSKDGIHAPAFNLTDDDLTDASIVFDYMRYPMNDAVQEFGWDRVRNAIGTAIVLIAEERTNRKENT